MFEFNTIEEAIEDLRQGKLILVTDDEDRETKVTSYVRRNLPLLKTLILWLSTLRDLSVCQ